MRVRHRTWSDLTPSSEIALRAHVSRFRSQESVTMDEVLASVRSTFPILGSLACRRDISLALRAVGFRRDRSVRDAIAYRNARR